MRRLFDGDGAMVKFSTQMQDFVHRLLPGCALLALLRASAHPQQPPGVRGAPNATTTTDGRYTPAPPQKFQGTINLNAVQSRPAWPPRIVPPKDAPNILLIM